MKKSKLALLHSVIALILCASMLVGTTFAWFTDTVNTGINTIAAGTLDVELYHSNAAVTDEQVQSDTKLFMDLQGNPILWEPGVVSFENLRVANEGDLALAYQLTLATANENFVVEASGASYGLSQVLKVGVVEGGITATDRAGVVASVGEGNWTTLSSFLRNGSLLPAGAGESEKVWGIVIWWEPGENDNFWNLNNGKQLNEGDVLKIDLGVKLIATQEQHESDAFGSDYDTDAKADVFPDFVGGTASAPVTPDSENRTAGEVSLNAGNVSAQVPAGVQLATGATALTLSVSEMNVSGSNVVLGENEAIRSLDVHIDGVAADNATPITVTLKEAAPKGLNMGNYKLYHVENGATNEMTLLGAADAFSAHNQFKYDPATGDIVLYMATFSEVAVVAEEPKWEGEFDYSWYTNAVAPVDGETVTEYIIANADQLAALSAIVGGMNGQTQDSFSGKTIKLISDINLGDKESANNPDIIFYPIGYYNNEGTYERTNTAITSGLRNFEGTFDGNGHTISNFYQNTWEMKGDHDWYSPEEQYYRDGMGLFGRVYGGTVKNLTVKNFSSDGEIATTGVIAAYADGATFENIAIFDCNPRVYNIGNGGIVGCVGWYAKEAGLKTTFKNITVDNSNKISALWGSYDVACGGIVGQYYPTSGQTSAGTPKNGGIHFENCHIAAQMDVYNDVCANYQYYAYRYTGMLIGSVRENETIDGHVYPKMDDITAKDCTVHFGTWNDYYYCEFEKNGHPSYSGPDDYKFSRVPESELLRDASGKVTGCKHEHTEVENNRAVYLPFNNLVTGYGWGVTTKVVGELEGVTILDREVADSEVKFDKADDVKVSYMNGKAIVIGDLFKAATLNDSKLKIVDKSVQVTVSPVGEDSTAGGTYQANTEDWTQGTLTFTGIGAATITITDYYFCTPTTIDVTITERTNEVKFETKFAGNFLYRVGNKNAVALGTLFKGTNVTNGNVTVAFETIAGNASGTHTADTTDWTKGTIQFSGNGTVKVTITDNDYCTPTELLLEVVDADNVTSATSATAKNIVLLNDCGFSSLEVSGGYTLYGNGFTMTCGSDSAALDMGYAFVTLDNGTLDNVQIVCPNFDYAVLYKSNMTESGNRSETTDRTRYFNVKSGVMVSGNSQILNSRISGGRAAVNVAGGNVVIDNSRIELGAVASILVGSANSLTLRDVTLVQKPTASTYDSSKTLMGFSVLFVCDADGNTAPVTLEGTLVQNAWVNETYKEYVPSAGQSIISTVLAKTEFLHDLDGDGTKESLNLGFAYMPESLTSKVNTTTITDNRTNKDTVPYDYAEVSILNGKTYVYSYKNANGTADGFKTESEYESDKYSDIIAVTYSDTADGLTHGKSYGTNGWVYELNVDLDKASGYALDFSKLAMSVNGVSVTDFKVNGNAKPTSPVAVTAGGVTYTLTATVDGKEYTATYKVTGTETSKESPSKISGPTTAGFGVAKGYGGDWSGAADVLTGVKIKYWSVAENKYVEFDFSNFTVPGNAGKLNGTNNYWEYTHTNNDFTLKVTNTVAIHSGKSVFGMPIRGTDGKLYFTISSTNGYVGSGTTSRSITMQYEFTDNNGGEKLTFTHTFNISYNKDDQYSYSDLSGSGKLTKLESSGGGGCVTPDTLITLADGTQKRIDQVKQSDLLLVWDFVKGEYATMPSAIIFNHGTGIYNVVTLNFSDGTTIKTINGHDFFDADLNQFVTINEDNVHNYVGHAFVKENGQLEKITLVGYSITEEYTTAYSILTAVHYNCFLENILTLSPNPIGGNFFMPFEVGEDMKFDAEKMQKDIETYGLFTYEEFAEYATAEQFYALNGPQIKVAVGKGIITMEQLYLIIQAFLPKN